MAKMSIKELSKSLKDSQSVLKGQKEAPAPAIDDLEKEEKKEEKKEQKEQEEKIEEIQKIDKKENKEAKNIDKSTDRSSEGSPKNKNKTSSSFLQEIEIANSRTDYDVSAVVHIDKDIHEVFTKLKSATKIKIARYISFKLEVVIRENLEEITSIINKENKNKFLD